MHLFLPFYIVSTNETSSLCGPFLLSMFQVCLCYAVLSVPFSLMVTCCKRADLLALLFFLFCHFLSLVFSVILSLFHMCIDP